MANNTNTNVSNPSRIPAGLSTVIEVVVGLEKVVAIQSLAFSETRTVERIQEVGTDGVVEIVPVAAAFIELTAERLVFERLRLPEAFARGFQHIQAQAVAFDITITHYNNYPKTDADNKDRKMVYKNCWFQAYGGTYRSGAYLITETATIWAERAITTNAALTQGILEGIGHPDALDLEDRTQAALDIEQDISGGNDLGALDEHDAALWFQAV